MLQVAALERVLNRVALTNEDNLEKVSIAWQENLIPDAACDQHWLGYLVLAL
jgi:hypothetical protein